MSYSEYLASDTFFAGIQIAGWLTKYPYATAFMEAFRQGHAPIGAEVIDERLDVKNDDRRPPHNTGIIFDENYSGPIKRYHYSKESILAARFASSPCVEPAILARLNKAKVVVNAIKWREGEDHREFEWNLDLLDAPDYLIKFTADDWDLHYAFGDVFIQNAKLKVNVYRNPKFDAIKGVIVRNTVRLVGTVKDDYDWDNGGAFADIDKHGARLMAGHGTHGIPGQIFRVDVDIDTETIGEDYNF